MITLALDASTYAATVAIFRGNELVAEREAGMRSADREAVLPAVDEAVRSVGQSMRDVDRVICGEGPGSFTSLRIAASVAKGLAYGLAVPLEAVSSLALVVAGERRAPGTYLACLDALRGESYVAGFSLDEHDSLRQTLPLQLVRNEDVVAVSHSIGAMAIGPSQQMAAMPHARGALKARTSGAAPVSLDGWEPVYGRKAEAQTKWEAVHGRPLPRG